MIKKLLSRLFICLWILVLLSCVNDPQSVIKLYIFNAETEKPIENAQVFFYIQKSRTDVEYSGSDGSVFTSWTGYPHRMNIKILKDGYYEKTITIEEQDFVPVDNVYSKAEKNINLVHK